MDAIIPDRETALRKDWRFQVQWMDGGRPCFYRCAQGETADEWAEGLRKEGRAPVVFDLRELLQLH